MNQQEALRRLEALEARARVVEFEQAFKSPEAWAQAERCARKLGVEPQVVIDESLEIARHIAEVGQDAWEAECLAKDRERAAFFGISLERYQAIDWDAEYAEWVANGAIPGAWRGRDWGVT